MPLGPGGYDSNGIWLYGEDDSEALASDLLNVGMQSVSDALGSAGNLVAVKSALFTGTQVASVGGGANVAVTDLSITHEVADPSNKLIISAFLGAAASNLNAGQGGLVGLAIHDGSGLIAVGDSAGLRTSITAGVQNSLEDREILGTSPAVTFVHTPGAGSKTYTVRAVNVRGNALSLYINRTEVDTDDENLPRTASALVIQEVVA